jgi:hypothetical protein
MAICATAQAARKFSAADLAVRRSATISKQTFCPSLRVQTGAFDSADMDENVLATVCRLNEAKALLAVKPLHNSLIHRDVLSLTVYTWALAHDLSWPLPGLVDFGEISEAAQSFGQVSIIAI